MLKTVTNSINASSITGVLPVANGGTGVTTSTGTGSTVLSAAPTLSGNVNLSTGNLVIGTSGKGIDFSATPGTGTSELLADYEEGTWTPVDSSGASLTLTVANATYTKVGRLVTANFAIVYPSTASVSTCRVGGLPFTSRSGAFSYPMVVSTSQTGICKTGLVDAGLTTFLLIDTGGNALTNVQMSGLFLRGTVIYEV
jgi:hypothetical protein